MQTYVCICRKSSTKWKLTELLCLNCISVCFICKLMLLFHPSLSNSLLQERSVIIAKKDHVKTSTFNQYFEKYLTINIQHEHQDHSNAKFWQLFDKRINTGVAFWKIQHLKPLLLLQIAHLFPGCNRKQGPATAARHFIQRFGNGTSWQICQIIHRI